MPDSRERLIVALDVSSAAAAHKIVAAVGNSARIYKVGMQLYTAEGPPIVRELIAGGREVFLDLKYLDIPNTVAAAVSNAARLGVRMLTVHASGGTRMLRVVSPCSRHTARICSGKLLWQCTEYRPCQPEPSGLGLSGTFWLSPIANNTSEPGLTSAPSEAVAVISYIGMLLLAWN